MEIMTIGMCLDYADEYYEQHDPDKPKRAKKATQKDFDEF
ncbi:hypothetical protein NCCP2716_23550 [Sporosarcina sp. NCCP-2716]|nr:hypothetical protein NCCP2716_23550 [Sporosarcina sp. NCCP-2716]